MPSHPGFPLHFDTMRQAKQCFGANTSPRTAGGPIAGQRIAYIRHLPTVEAEEYRHFVFTGVFEPMFRPDGKLWRTPSGARLFVKVSDNIPQEIMEKLQHQQINQ